MHLESFKYFHEIIESKSISKAAANCHISQSALSQQIQKLEDNLGYTLLIRSNKGVQLTDYGQIVQKYAENLIRTYYKMLEDLENLDKNNNIVRIGSCWTLATYALPCTLYSMKKKYSNHNYDLISDSSDSIEENVLNDIYDLGFIYGEPKDASLSRFKIGEEKLVLVASPTFKIPKEIPVENLINYPFISLSNKLRVKDTLNTHLEEFGYTYDDLNILFSLDSTESVKSSLNKGYGISFLPYLSVKKDLYLKQLKEIKISNLNASYEIYLIHKNNMNINDSVREFIQYFKKIGKKSFC